MIEPELQNGIGNLDNRPNDAPDLPTADAVSADDEIYLTLRVQLPDGRVLSCAAADGLNLVDLMRSAGLPVKAECGGACVCATCHVRLDAEWRSRVTPAHDEELDKLDEIPGADETSRLACQITMRDDLDGLVISLQQDSLADAVSEAAE
ncbi:MAG: 2Fe-2S iron-sulfur cluster-binding protein [Pseudomonadota bacterium]